MTNENQQQDQQENAGKIGKKYDTVMKLLTAVVGGTANLKPTSKVGGDTLADIVGELFAEEQEAFEKSIKSGLSEILKKHVTTVREIAKAEKDLEALKNAKKKEFIEAAEKWLAKIEQNDVLNNAYQIALEEAFKEEGVDNVVDTKTASDAPAASAENTQQ